MHLQEFKAGEVVFKKGSSGDCAFIIESGEIALYPNSSDDDVLAILKQGELLGEMGVISGSARSASAYAHSDVELLLIDREQITNRLTNSDPIIRSIMEVLLKRIRNMLDVDDATLESSDGSFVVSEGMHKIRFERELFRALENGEMVNVYQPMVDFKTGEVAGFEALSRWQHPEKGMISPFKFISLAEESDFIVPMGLKIFDSACKQLGEFQQVREENNPELPPLFMSINVSAPQLTAKGFLGNIQNIVLKHKISPNNIKVEITESLVVDYKRVQTWMDECHNFGFKLSLDDFGTGHSGFEHLLELDFNTIKIDQAFVKSMFTNPKSMIMLEVIVDMAKRMDMSIVAEGIEDIETANQLKKIGVDYAQGYYFFKPMNPNSITKLL